MNEYLIGVLGDIKLVSFCVCIIACGVGIFSLADKNLAASDSKRRVAIAFAIAGIFTIMFIIVPSHETADSIIKSNLEIINEQSLKARWKSEPKFKNVHNNINSFDYRRGCCFTTSDEL